MKDLKKISRSVILCKIMSIPVLRFVLAHLERREIKYHKEHRKTIENIKESLKMTERETSSKISTILFGGLNIKPHIQPLSYRDIEFKNKHSKRRNNVK